MKGLCSPVGAVREGELGADVGDVNDSAGGGVFCSINDELVGDLDLFGDVLAANFVFTETQSAAFLRSSGALTPANGADTVSAVLASRVAQSAAELLVRAAGQLAAMLATVRVLGAGDANISHSRGAIGRANAASNGVETVVAFRVPESSPFLAVRSTLVHLASTTAVSVRLVAVGTVVTEALVVGAVLPADRTDARVASLARSEAESAILLQLLWTGAKRLARSAARGFLPARVRHIGVVVVVMEVVDGSAIVVLLGVGQGLLGVLGEVRHVGLVFVVAVVALVRQGVVVRAVDAAVVVGAVVEVLRVVVGVVVAMLHLVVGVVVVAVVVHRQVLGLVAVVVQGQVVVVSVVLALVVVLVVHSLHETVVVVVVFMAVFVDFVRESVAVVGRLMSHRLKVGGAVQRNRVVNGVFRLVVSSGLRSRQISGLRLWDSVVGSTVIVVVTTASQSLVVVVVGVVVLLGSVGLHRNQGGNNERESLHGL